jgi:hypothetical protein
LVLAESGQEFFFDSEVEAPTKSGSKGAGGGKLAESSEFGAETVSRSTVFDGPAATGSPPTAPAQEAADGSAEETRPKSAGLAKRRSPESSESGEGRAAERRPAADGLAAGAAALAEKPLNLGETAGGGEPGVAAGSEASAGDVARPATRGKKAAPGLEPPADAHDRGRLRASARPAGSARPEGERRQETAGEPCRSGLEKTFDDAANVGGAKLSGQLTRSTAGGAVWPGQGPGVLPGGGMARLLRAVASRSKARRQAKLALERTGVFFVAIPKRFLIVDWLFFCRPESASRGGWFGSLRFESLWPPVEIDGAVRPLVGVLRRTLFGTSII